MIIIYYSDTLTTLWNTLRHPILILSKQGQLGPPVNHKKVSVTFLLYSCPTPLPWSVGTPCCESRKSDCDIFAYSRPALTLKKTSGQLEPLVNHIFGPIWGEHYPLKLNPALPILGVAGRRPASASWWQKLTVRGCRGLDDCDPRAIHLPANNRVRSTIELLPTLQATKSKDFCL